MNHLIRSSKRTHVSGVAQLRVFTCFILCLCPLGVSGQEEKCQPAVAGSSVDRNIEWSLEVYSIRGHDWNVHFALEGGVRYVDAENNGEFYGFHLGEMTETTIVVPAGKMGKEPAYANEVEVVRKNDKWKARYPHSISREANAAALDIVELVMQGLQLHMSGECVFESQRTMIIPAEWNYENSKVDLRHKAVLDKRPSAILWEEESGQTETLVWWALCTGEDKTRVLRVERYRGAIKLQPSYSEFKEYVGELRGLFISNKLSAEHIMAYAGAVDVAIISLVQRSVLNMKEERRVESISREVEYVLPKEEMDELLEKYTPDHPLVRQHEKK